MATLSTTADARAVASSTTRWTQLIVCIACMILIANLQYGWTFFVNPINKAHGWSIASIQFAFSIFIALETWLTPIHGWIADSLGKFGPKLVIAFGGICVAAGWIINSHATTLEMLYLGAVVGGTGGGAVYATCVGLAVKWFPDRRGLAVGLTAAGYGAGTALTVIPILHVINSAGYQAAFFWFGLVQGGLVFLLAWLLRSPEPGELTGLASAKVAQSAQSYSPWQVLSTPVFWLLYIMFIMVSASGLMATAQLAPIAKDFDVGGMIIMFGLTTLGLAGIVDNICNGGARPLFGWISDNIGREYTMAIAFGLGGISYWLLGTFGHAPWGFVIFAALIFLTWGEIFSLFPSTCTDTFGPKFATVNLCLLYTAKGASAFLVPVANLVKTATGGWHMVFVITAIMNFIVVALALFVLKPIRQKFMRG
ncbi:MAG TPA: oxalate/formate MFS antiporter [Xanthobacteraceae bacterium]|jgi:OFA family oxalate/formate antiporter-like MFS transporter|nr:oxalate/formate MFS antiporter [Xanthobacteraceae bacterium]